ncbi:HMG box protein [Pochonia chlamydosporia 170]|uniref:HMG box protein n=1 Tax=Pochonia chlamydosporia 170 TaxID=1380566 RepID=A0A179F1Q7_METCM|nr:HMG box protein [Pochonia chlamydosporia 170]OAQ59377.1 HMG box protein [Pochonia chlamydosporia 170]
MPSGYKHGDTPQKAMVRGTISYLESQGLPVNKSAIFRHFELSRSQGYAALSSARSKRNDPEWEETRGRPSKISSEDQQKMENILWDEAYENVYLNWAGLAKHSGVEMDFNSRTMHRAMGTMGYRRCLACGRGWVNRRVRERRVEWARKMLDTFAGDDMAWKRVRFGSELHFGFGLDGAMRVLPRPGEKYCPSCDEAHDEIGKEEPMDDARWSRDVKRVHAWACVGYNFKSELVFYDESTSPNSSGTITMTDYRDKVLEKHVKPWLQPSNGGPQSFTLEEDADSFAHGSGSKVNLVQQWKDANSLRSHFNCGDSPDLSPLDSLWPAGKQWKLSAPLKDWGDESLRDAARRAWKEVVVEQDRVNVWVGFMTARLRAVIDSEGKMVPW